MSGALNRRVAVITGGSSGIGLATAKRFVEEGASVYIFGRRRTELDKAVAEIGGDVTAVSGDVADQADVARLFDTVRAAHGRVDVVFANAATLVIEPLGRIREDSIDRMLTVNVKGVILTVKGAFPLLSEGSRSS